MSDKYATGRFAIAECDRCGQRYKLKELRTQVLKTKPFKVKVCRTCYDPDHPQLQIGMYPVYDAMAIYDARPDVSYQVSGTNGVRTNPLGTDVYSESEFGYPESGSRVFQWGWNPVGGAIFYNRATTPNSLLPVVTIGTVTVITT